MKIKTTLALLALGLSLSACNLPVKPVKPAEQPTTVVSCVNKHESSLNFSYEPSKAVKWHSLAYDVDIYLITTTDDKQLALNSLELENYNCK